MRQVWITKAGAPEVLQVREAKDPEAKEGQVRVRVKAAGINFADLMARVGLYPDAPPIPCVVGYEVAGVVDQVGKGVTDVKEGQRVLAMPKFGGYTDTLVLPASQALSMPDKMTFEEGAALPVTYLTAHTMMFMMGNLREGGHILIHSAAGGVGTAAIQLAKTKHAVIYGTASPGKHDWLRKAGVAHPIDSTQDYAPQVRKALGERGLDMILDPVGGSSWKKGYDLLDDCGHLVCFGLSAAASGNTRSLWAAITAFLSIKKYNPMELMDKNRTVSGCNMGHLFHRLDLLLPQMDKLIGMYEAGLIAPQVDKSFSFDDAPKAHQWIHDRKAIGKVLLTP